MKKILPSTALTLCGAITSLLHAQSTTNLWIPGTGAWSNDAQWSLGTAPSTTDRVLITNTASSYVVTIDSATPANTLTNYSLAIGVNNGTLTTQRLEVLSAPVPWRIHDQVLIDRPRGFLFIDDSTVSVGTNIRVAGNLYAADSAVRVTDPTSTFGLQIGGANSVAAFSGGSLIITNAANGGTIIVGNNSIGGGNLFATNTLIRVGTLSQGTRTVYIDNSGLTDTNLLRTVSVSVLGDTAASLTLAGGIFESLGTVNLSAGFAGAGVTATITNSGATWNVSAGIFNIGGTAGSQGQYIHGGGTTRLARVGGESGELRIGTVNTSTGRLVVTGGLLAADGDGLVGPTLNGRGALAVGAQAGSIGIFTQSDGRVVITNSPGLGQNAEVRIGVRGDGYFEMTGGTMLADRFVLGTNAKSFMVGPDALIEIKQASGLSNNAPMALASSFDFDGTLKFSPATATMTQQLMLAGIDTGTGVEAYSNNFSLGTLDLDSFGLNNRLRLVAPYQTASTALYVSAISSIATNALISSFNVYYDPQFNMALYNGAPMGTYLLSGGGFLIPLPEPGVGVLVLMAASGFLARARRLV